MRTIKAAPGNDRRPGYIPAPTTGTTDQLAISGAAANACAMKGRNHAAPNGCAWRSLGALRAGDNRCQERLRSPIMTTIQIELPESTAQAARAAGLLTSEALDRLLVEAIRRRQAADELLAIADRVAAAGIEPMSMEEINAEVKAARAERHQRATHS